MTAAGAPTTSTLARAAYRTGRVLGRVLAFVERVPPWLVLGTIVFVNWAIAAEIGRIAVHDGPLYYHGGDATWYWTSAWTLAHGSIPYASIGYGYPLLIAPIAAIAGPNLLTGLPAVIVFDQVVLAPIAIVCVYGIARLLAGRAYAYLATTLWVLFPVLVIHYFLADYHTRWVDVTLPSWVGLTPLGDFPSMVVLLVAAYFTLRSAAWGRDADALAAGFAVGIAIAVKPANGLFVPAAVLALLVARRLRGLGFLAAAIVPSVIGLTAWKERGIGVLPVFHNGAGPPVVVACVALALVAGIHLNVNHYLHFDWAHLHHQLDGLREYTLSQRLIYFGALGGLVGLARRSTPAAVLAGTWLAAYVVFKGSTTADIVGGGFFTHLLAAFPAYFMMLISLPFLIPFYGRRRSERATPRPGGRLPAVAAAILGFVAVAGALAVAVLPTSTTASAARTGDSNLLLPIDAFPVSAAAGNGVTLSWKPQPTRGADVTYAVFRARANHSDCTHDPGASSTCDYGGAFIGSTDGRTTSFVDHPPAGAWRYRVALSATPMGPQYPSDLILLSRPVQVIARR
jgi:hypothetical protein